MDQIAFDAMVKEGFPKNNLRVTGNPHFDCLFAESQGFTQAQRQALKERIGLPGDTLFFTMVEFSTVGVEAVYMRRPCISLQPGLIGQDPLLLSRGGVIPAGYTDDSCRELLIKSANRDYRQELLRQSAGFSNDGKATERLADLVYELLSRQ